MAKFVWKYNSADKQKVIKLASDLNIHPIIAEILIGRGWKDTDAISAFIHSNDYSYPNHISNSWINMQNNDLKYAIERIIMAIHQGEPIIVYGDFDADGVTSTVLLVEVLESLGAIVQPYIPSRVDEGYGLNIGALHKIASQGYKLVVSVDCGIRAEEEIKIGVQYGLDIIVTDHHLFGDNIPKANAIVNPKDARYAYPEDMLAGVGVAYRFAEVLISRFLEHYAPPTNPYTTLKETEDLVAIGTVADMAPMDRLDNRFLVTNGITQIKNTVRPGLKHMMMRGNIDLSDIGSNDIGFGIGPRINAAGRISDPMIAYKLLKTRDGEEGRSLAEEIESLNQQRQELTALAYKTALDNMPNSPEESSILIVASRDFQPGVVGLVAGKLCREYNKPAIVLHMEGDMAHGSCRSTAGIDVTMLLKQCDGILEKYGGHAQAAGVTIKTANIPALYDRLSDQVSSLLDPQLAVPSLNIDAVVDINDLNMNMYNILRKLEPTGHMHSIPTLMSDMVVLETKKIGKGGEHLKLKIATRNKPLDAVAFGMGNMADSVIGAVRAVYHLDLNVWNGQRNLQLIIQDIKL